MKLREILQHKVLIRESIVFVLINLFFITVFALVIMTQLGQSNPQHLENPSTPADTTSAEPLPLNHQYSPTKN